MRICDSKHNMEMEGADTKNEEKEERETDRGEDHHKDQHFNSPRIGDIAAHDHSDGGVLFLYG